MNESVMMIMTMVKAMHKPASCIGHFPAHRTPVPHRNICPMQRHQLREIWSIDNVPKSNLQRWPTARAAQSANESKSLAMSPTYKYQIRYKDDDDARVCNSTASGTWVCTRRLLHMTRQTNNCRHVAAETTRTFLHSQSAQIETEKRQRLVLHKAHQQK